MQLVLQEGLGLRAGSRLFVRSTTEGLCCPANFFVLEYLLLLTPCTPAFLSAYFLGELNFFRFDLEDLRLIALT